MSPRQPLPQTTEKMRKLHWSDAADVLTSTHLHMAHVIEEILGHGLLTVHCALEQGLAIPRAVALRDQESAGTNVFGGDWGDVGDRPPYYHQHVTKERVQLLRARGTYRHGMNGIGEIQLTWWEFVEMAENLGGAHLRRPQFTVGFGLLATYLEKYPALEAYGAYNAGETNRRDVMDSYSRPMARRVKAWTERLEI